MAILNYTTKIDYHKTIGEISKILVDHGARNIQIRYSPLGLPEALVFVIEMKGRMISFSLAARSAGVLRAMAKAKVPKTYQTEEQSVRVSWRIIKDWVEAQMAIVEAELAEMAEIFLPYAVMKNGQTIYEELQKEGSKFLLT